MSLLMSGHERVVFDPVAKWQRSYKVTDRYVPRPGRRDVLTFLKDHRGRNCHALLDESLYDKFEVGDVLRFPRSNPMMPNAEGWLSIQPPFDVLHSVPPTEVLSIAVGYISKPVRICGSVYFVTAIGPQKWLKIPYEVAKNYFESGQASKGRGKDFYGALGVNRDATMEQIRAGYRGLVKQFHHDAGEHPSEEAMRWINEAYDVLSDPGERSKYDQIIGGKRTLMGWPGSGAGKLEILGEDRGSLVCAIDILSFTREQRTQMITFSTGAPNNLPYIAVVPNQMLDLVWRNPEITQKEVLTDKSVIRIVNRFYPEIPAVVRVRVELRKRAHWNPDRGDLRYTWDVRDHTIVGYDEA